MLLIVPLFNKVSFLGSLINKCRPAAIASLSLSSQSNASKSLEEKAGLPPRPKKPLTAYFRFMKEERPKLKITHPHLSVAEIIKHISLQWHNADSNLKQRLQEEYKKDQQKYVEIRTKYDSKLSQEQRSQLKELKQERIDAKERRMMRKRIKDLGRPKKPASPFLRFLSKERAATLQTSNETYREWHQKVTAKWAKLPDEEKSVYIKESRKELEIYQKEISFWEEKMMRLGNIDVVRQGNLIDPTAAKPKKV